MNPSLKPLYRIDPRYSRYVLLVARSPIHRYGVFAGQAIPAQRRVIEYAGEKISHREADRRFSRILRLRRPRRFYFFVLNRRWVVDGAVGGTGAELINHGCAPNLMRRRIRGHIYYYSRRRIRAGEELLIDYRYSPETVRQKCRCGSPKCRGTLNLR
ncbi:MAG TPA: SET domain-containing protein-lysine N-methyltransferase [Patescibacteria group bacterium]|nr:SET domain-containing protein-lysine N-methyltransferase [Patescibacteria group bacterium]